MQAEQEQALKERQEAKVQKQKFAVALLLCGLFVAILCQPDDQTISSATNRSSTTPLAIKSTVLKKTIEQQDADNAQKRLNNNKELTHIDVATASSSDLFLIAKQPRQLENTKAAVETSPHNAVVNVIYGEQASQQTALIGDEVVRPGEELRDGRLVIAVDASDGVRLQSTIPNRPKPNRSK